MTVYCGVVGPGTATRDEEATAEDVGAEAAKRGWVVVCGGLGGVMAAACRGAASAGGTTVGILPGTSHDDANAHVGIRIPTGLGEARNALVVRACHGLVAVGGEYGTLSEIALALKAGKPVVGVGTWDIRGVTTAAGARQAVESLEGALRRARGGGAP